MVVADIRNISADDIVQNSIIVQAVLRATPDHNPAASTLQRAVCACFGGCDQEWAAVQGFLLKKLVGHARCLPQVHACWMHTKHARTLHGHAALLRGYPGVSAGERLAHGLWPLPQSRTSLRANRPAKGRAHSLCHVSRPTRNLQASRGLARYSGCCPTRSPPAWRKRTGWIPAVRQR